MTPVDDSLRDGERSAVSRDWLSRLVSLGALAFAVTILLAFGVFGVGRGMTFAQGNFDMNDLYLAGRLWLQGLNPYDPAPWAELTATHFGTPFTSFAYPPTVFPICFLLELFASASVIWAKVAMTVLNLSSVGALAWLSIRLCESPGTPAVPHWREPAAYLSAAFLIANQHTAAVVWMGQTSLVAAALVLGSWYLADRGSDWAAGVLLGLSSMKPQFGLLFGLWFLLGRRWRLLEAAALTALAAAAFPLAAVGPVPTLQGWLRTVSAYQHDFTNLPAFPHMFGVRSVADALGVELPNLAPLAVGIALALYPFRERLGRALAPGILFCVEALFISAHGYDLVGAAIIGTPLTYRLRSSWRRSLALALAVFISVPLQIWLALGAPRAMRLRELALSTLVLLAVGA